MTDFVPGQQIEAQCTRCKDTTGHVIVLVLDGQIAKVQCKACGSLHKYYAPRAKGSPAPRQPKAVKATAAGGVRAASANKAPARSSARAEQQALKTRQELEAKWQNAVNQHPGPAVPYAMDRPYRLGNMVDHQVFGLGLVLGIPAPDKMEVLFREGLKSLRCRS